MHPISKKLYKIYKKHNPSVPTNFLKNKKKRERILENKLKFPLRFFKNMDVVDVACGTGDYSLIYAQNGAKVKGYDFKYNSKLNTLPSSTLYILNILSDSIFFNM